MSRLRPRNPPASAIPALASSFSSLSVLKLTFWWGRAREDYANFTRGPLKAGDTVRITSFVHYDIGPDGRFAAIRIGRYGD